MAPMRAELPEEEKIFVVEKAAAAFLASFPVTDIKETEKMKRKIHAGLLHDGETERG